MSQAERPIRATLEENDALLRVVLNRPKGNILDGEMVAAIRAELRARAEVKPLRTILFEGEGRHFSFGASVEEHQPARVGAMLAEFHGLFRDLAASGKVLLAAVNGLCLGGGLELATFCHRVFAATGAQFGNPEIKLGVFAPIASIVLPRRVGQPAADDLLLTGRTVDSAQALAMGLVDEVAEDPGAAAHSWHRDHLVPLSAAALFHAVGAARLALHRDLHEALVELERRYLEDLVATHDANEGITAFLEKRAPKWEHA